MKPGPANSRGVALITVMFIMMLLTTLVVYLVEDEHLSIRRTANQQEAEQSFHIAVYSEQWARHVLGRDARDSDSDHLLEEWSTAEPTPPEPDTAVLETNIEDLQGRFNLNNLAAGRESLWYPAFQRLLTVLELEPAVADALIDWLDSDINVSGHDGAEDAEYMLESPSYRAANRNMVEVGELAWVRGMTPEAMQALRPHVTVLPASDTPVNVNTASPELIQALGPEILNAAAAESLVEARGEDGYTNTNQFLIRPEVAGQGNEIEPLITVRSEYFQVHSEVEHGRYGTVLYSVIERALDTGRTRVLQRRRGLS